MTVVCESATNKTQEHVACLLSPLDLTLGEVGMSERKFVLKNHLSYQFVAFAAIFRQAWPRDGLAGAGNFHSFVILYIPPEVTFPSSPPCSSGGKLKSAIFP